MHDAFFTPTGHGDRLKPARPRRVFTGGIHVTDILCGRDSATAIRCILAEKPAKSGDARENKPRLIGVLGEEAVSQ